MTEQEITSIIQLADSKWATNQTLTDYDIRQMSKEIVSTPSIIHENSEGVKTPLFTTSQMYNMFRLGFYIRQHVGSLKRVVKRRNTPYGQAIYSRVRNLNIDEELKLPISEYGAARTAASKTRKLFGSVYIVTKVSEEQVIVKRIK